MSDKPATYRQIAKSISLFSSVQFIQIIVQIVRSKFIAVLLGPVGVGIAGLLNTTIGLLGNLTNLGLGTSAVRYIAESFSDNNKQRTGEIIITIRRWVWATGLAGLIITLCLSRWLSVITFGNRDFTWSFIFLSSSLLLRQLTSGQLVVFQGLRKLKFLAKANVTGSIAGLFLTVPMYYFWGLKGIVPAIITTSIISLFASIYYYNKTDVPKSNISLKQSFNEGKTMIRLGFYISMSGFVSLGAFYIVRIFITHSGSIGDVGLYNAGFALINTYVALIFTSMGTDYFPRLSMASKDTILANRIINQQIEMSVLIIAPIIIVFLIFVYHIVLILYSKQFLEVNYMIKWAAPGMVIKAISWSIGFLFLAKGSGRLFFWNELLTNLYILVLNILGYHYFGFTGLGMSFFAGYCLIFLQILIISSLRFHFRFEYAALKISIVQFLLVILVFIFSQVIDNSFKYFVCIPLFLLSLLYSYRELNKRMAFRELLHKLIHKDKE